ncbi:MAG: TetR/AcrR family transcriptional regulator [Acetobacteraceae bacterium]|jgi:AcrR family transcriptional regulator
MTPPRHASTRTLLLAGVIRAQDDVPATVDHLCGAAGVSKRSSFHRFPGKEQLGIAAIQQSGEAQ